MTDESQPDAISRALQHHVRGELREAEEIYRQVLQSDPLDPNAPHLLGVIAYQRGNNPLAVELIQRAIAINAEIPDFYVNLGNALRALDRLEEAASMFLRAISLDPRSGEAYHNLGLVLRQQGRIDEAAGCLREFLKISPDLPDGHNSLGLILLDQGMAEDAVRSFEKAIQLRPGYAAAQNNLGSALRVLGRHADARRRFEEALRLCPALAEAHSNLGLLLRDEGRMEEAIACGREALRLDPALIDAHVNLASLLHDHGLHQEASERYEHALALKPGHIAAALGKCMAQLDILYDTPEDIRASRERYRINLEELSRNLRLDDSAVIEAASRVVGGAQPFCLAYQGEVDRDLQKTYGSLICRIQAARYPEWSETPPLPPLVPGKLRVGIVSGYFHYHSNWKIPIKGWVENLDPSRIALYGYYTGNRRDAETRTARGSFVRFFEEAGSLDALRRAIGADRLHVLIYPEVGMDRRTLQLASLRLAPVQCVSWGHPDTSGMPSIDYFLSSELMEPPDADDHYSEKLVRLPNLSIHYTPLEIQPAAVDRAGFGLRENSVLYLCAQSLYKYLPQHDDVFPLIALGAGDCQFVFLDYAGSRQVGDRFRARLERAFTRHGLQAESHVKILPRLDPARYKALNLLADVFLDSIGWSGCNSTLEAIGCGLPVVTLPGNLMRGRHSFAILKMMGLDDAIACSIEDYVSSAVRMGRDRPWRNLMAGRVKENAHRVYQDLSCVRALEEFLERAVTQAAAP